MNPKPTYKELQSELIKLKQNKSEYKSTIENLPVGVVVHAADTSIILSNQKAHEILGLTKEQMEGKTAIDPTWKFIHEDKSVMKVENYPVSKVISTKKPLNDYIIGIIKPDNDNVTWVNIKAMPIFNAKKDIEKIIVNFIDITKRKIFEHELQEQNEEYATLNEEYKTTNEELLIAKEKSEENKEKLKEVQQIALLGNWELDLANNKLSWSDEIYRIFDLKPQEFEATYESFLNNIHPDDKERVNEAYTNSLKTKLPAPSNFIAPPD